MSYSLTINGVDYTNYTRIETLSVTESLQIRGSTMTCTIYIADAAIATPQSGQYIVLTVNGTKEFAGRIAVVRQLQLGLPTNLGYTLDCIDHTADFDMELLNTKFDSGLAGDIIRYIVGKVGRNFTSNNVTDGITVNAIDVEYETPSSVIQRIADSIEHSWYIDYDRDVHFFNRLGWTAPLAEIDIDSDVATYDNLEWREAWEQVKNYIILTGAKVKSGNQRSISVTADGAQRFWALGYEPWDMDSITIKVNNVEQNKFVDTVEGQAGDGKGSSGDVYVCFDNFGVRFPDDHPPPNGQTVDIDFNYAYEAAVVVFDPTSIAAMRARENVSSAPSNGIHMLQFDVPDIRADSEAAIYDYGQLLLLRYSDVLYTAGYHSTVQGWRAGQTFHLTSTVRDINKTMYVTRVVKSIRHTERTVPETLPFTFDYTIEASSSPFPG